SFSGVILSQTQLTTQPDEQTIEIQDAPDMEVIAFSKTIIIKKQAKAVFVFGGDIIIEGRVDGDVGVIGGTIIQKEGSFIGGDVIVFGGAYRAESQQPLRGEGKQTIVYGILEEELRDIGRNPGQILSPAFTPAFLAQRILSVLFWFVVTLIVTTLAPGAVSRAITRTRLSALKVAGFGLIGLIASLAIVTISVSTLPDYLSTMTGLMIVVLLMLAYLFGRVTLQLSVGKIVQKYLFPNFKPNETVAILIGVLIWTILLSIPYIWTLAVLALFAAGVGLVLTARSGTSWRTS
ncbi:MAG TPA: hypothetical protein VK612_11575, partial [Pyrinomonadaceae bacterium]|nr:hypothetical protein [Pyrinomonadaceae bacterium]